MTIVDVLINLFWCCEIFDATFYPSSMIHTVFNHKIMIFFDDSLMLFDLDLETIKF